MIHPDSQIKTLRVGVPARIWGFLLPASRRCIVILPSSQLLWVALRTADGSTALAAPAAEELPPSRRLERSLLSSPQKGAKRCQVARSKAVVGSRNDTGPKRLKQ